MDGWSKKELAHQFLCHVENIKKALWFLHFRPPDKDPHKYHFNHYNNNRFGSSEQLYDMFKQYKCDALVENGILQQEQVDHAKMVLFLSHMLHTEHCTWDSLVTSAQKTLTLAKSENQGLVMELLLDLNAEAADRHANDGSDLWAAPEFSENEDGELSVTGGLFDLPAWVKEMSRESTTATTGGGGAGGNPRPTERDNHKEYAQISLEFILVGIFYDHLLTQHQQQQQPMAVDTFLQAVQRLRMYSPPNNESLVWNAPFWYLFDLFMAKLTITAPAIHYIVDQLCDSRLNHITVLKEAIGVSGFALEARCVEMIMDRSDKLEDKNAALEACSTMMNGLHIKYLQDLYVSGRMDVVTNVEEDASGSLREKLLKSEYPLMIRLRLLLKRRELVPAMLQVTKMEEVEVFEFAVIYQAYKLVFESLLYHGRLFDTNQVPAQESLQTMFFPRCGQDGIRILAYLYCEVLQRIQTPTTTTTTTTTPELAYVRHSCHRALLQLLFSKYTLEDGLKYYEKLRREDQFSVVLEGPMSLARAKDICENECRIPESGFPDLAAVLRVPDDQEEEE